MAESFQRISRAGAQSRSGQKSSAQNQNKYRLLVQSVGPGQLASRSECAEIGPQYTNDKFWAKSSAIDQLTPGKLGNPKILGVKMSTHS